MRATRTHEPVIEMNNCPLILAADHHRHRSSLQYSLSATGYWKSRSGPCCSSTAYSSDSWFVVLLLLLFHCWLNWPPTERGDSTRIHLNPIAGVIYIFESRTIFSWPKKEFAHSIAISLDVQKIRLILASQLTWIDRDGRQATDRSRSFINCHNNRTILFSRGLRSTILLTHHMVSVLLRRRRVTKY